jgi:hypothetical protein
MSEIHNAKRPSARKARAHAWITPRSMRRLEAPCALERGPRRIYRKRKRAGVECLCGGKMNGCDRLGHGVDLCWFFFILVFLKKSRNELVWNLFSISIPFKSRQSESRHIQHDSLPCRHQVPRQSDRFHHTFQYPKWVTLF